MSKYSIFFLSMTSTLMALGPLITADVSPLLVMLVFIVFLLRFIILYKRQVVHGALTAVFALVATVAVALVCASSHNVFLARFGIVLVVVVLLSTLLVGYAYSYKRGVLR